MDGAGGGFVGDSLDAKIGNIWQSDQFHRKNSASTAPSSSR